MPDGRWTLVAVGGPRVRVRAWLDDAPYPRAQLEEWPDLPADAASDAALLGDAVACLRRVLALSELHGDPVLAGYQACALAPLGPLDRYALLEAPDHDDRMRLLTTLLAELEQDLYLRIGLEGPAG